MKYQISAAEINQSETEIIGGPKLSIVSAGGTLAIAKKKKKKNFMAPFFYGWGSTASRLQPLRGGSLSTSKG